MSLILEALRKSEERRRLGEAPTLASESAWSARRRHPLAQRDRRPLWLLLVVFALAGSTAAWWLLRDATREAPVVAREQAAAPAPASGAPVAPSPVVASMPPAATPAAAVVEPAPPPAATTAPAPAPAATPVDLAAADARTQERLAQRQAPAPTPAAVPEPAQEAVNVPPVATPAPDQAPPPPVATPEAAAPPPVAQPVVDGVPEIWQLALPTRQALPALVLSMHVYHADPARRFALINDERVAEGSPLGNDLNVREIRPDGVVLEFRGERFLLPRTGR
jgi:general secretion pathway protein B